MSLNTFSSQILTIFSVSGYRESPILNCIQPNILQPTIGQVVFIIQHPDGATLKISSGAVQRNENRYVYDNTNTMKGSSGAPVMFDDWNL